MSSIINSWQGLEFWNQTSLEDRPDLHFDIAKIRHLLDYNVKMKIYLARHGRTNYNDLNLCNGDPSIDVRITDLGIKQAHNLADKLKEKPIDHIYVSEMQRTRQTAEIVNKFHHATVETSPLLNDHRSGFEGKNAQLLMDALDAAGNRWTASFNGGESIEDMKQRAAMFLEELKAKPYSTVLIVTSGWVIKMLVAVIENIPNEEAWNREAEQGDHLELEI
jgi:broad specificity phosphatase PhoE